MTTRIGINGFGRIGRSSLRVILDSFEGELEVVKINDLTDNETLAHLLKYDTAYGHLGRTVEHDETSITVGGHHIEVSEEKDPADINWGALDVDIVLECTGKFRTKEDAQAHIDAGAKKVIISAPGKNVDGSFVWGVNHEDYTNDLTVISAASCTTNSLAPVAKIINDNFGIVSGLMTTIHAYTGDQRLQDAPHKDLRRARAAAQNIVPTTTGAAKAVSKALPELEGKLTGNAIRVPTPDVSMAVLNLELEKEVEKDEVNEFLRRVSTDSSLRQQIDYINSPDIVSTDLLGSTHAGVVDGLATIASGNHLVLYVWYDNEYGYSNQVVRIVEDIAGVRPEIFPARKEPSEIR